MTLRYYQQDAHDAAIDWIKKSTESCVIEAETGSGKSHIIAAIAKTFHEISGKHVLCTAPNVDLVRQNTEKFIATGNPASVFSASIGKSLRHPVVFGTPLSIHNQIQKFGDKFGLICIDECFSGETLIETSKGIKRIDEINHGDMVHHYGGCGIVRGVFSKISETIKLELSNGSSITCTKDHPIFTEKGFVEAERLENGARFFSREEVQKLRKCFSSEIHDIKERINCCKYLGISLGKARFLLSILRKEEEKPNVKCPEQRENALKAKGNKTQTLASRRQRKIAKHTSISIASCSWKRVGNGVRNTNRSRPFEWCISKLLQSGYRKQREKISHRNRWLQSLYARKKREGQEKRRPVKNERMVCLSNIKQEGHRIVYNLRVSGHPSYFANGILVHNCHGITPTIQNIIKELRTKNNNLRVIGLSATPYRLGSGLIYAVDEHGKPSPETQCVEPYFAKKVYTIGGRELIDQGFLTPPVIGAIHGDHYDTINMQLNSMGKFYQEDIDRAYEGQNRKTANIIADVIAQSRYRNGVMIFAATVKHAMECMESLPPELSRMIGGDINTDKDQRKKLVDDFKRQKYKYLVSVGTMTTGVDFTHVDVIALMRATESIGLLKQCVGRGLRLHEGKKDVLVLDYAENIERHCGEDGDIFSPKIKANKPSNGGGGMLVICPLCNTENDFTARKNEDGFAIDDNGYFIDLMGERIMTDFGAMPAHYGRRCFGQELIKGQFERCNYRWTSKPCPHCEADNDIAARYCCKCKGEIIDPNEKLIADFKAMKKDPYQIQCDKVITWHQKKTLTKKGEEMLVIDWVTEYRKFPIFYLVRRKEYAQLIESTQGGDVMPDTITYRKDKQSGFYRVLDYNQ